jgi:hypothetical protein
MLEKKIKHENCVFIYRLSFFFFSFSFFQLVKICAIFFGVESSNLFRIQNERDDVTQLFRAHPLFSQMYYIQRRSNDFSVGKQCFMSMTKKLHCMKIDIFMFSFCGSIYIYFRKLSSI